MKYHVVTMYKSSGFLVQEFTDAAWAVECFLYACGHTRDAYLYDGNGFCIAVSRRMA